MTIPVTPEEHGSSTRPYLIRALHDWCTDNGFTPYVAVFVDRTVQVPIEYVKNNEIVLNVGFEATSGLKLGNEFIEFKARFGGSSREIVVPIDHVVAIYARENGQGMAFPVPAESRGLSSVQPTPPEPAVLRGLRLAQTDEATEATEATVRPPVPKTGWSDDQPPEPPPPAPGSRPALKRIK